MKREQEVSGSLTFNHTGFLMIPNGQYTLRGLLHRGKLSHIGFYIRVNRELFQESIFLPLIIVQIQI